MSVDLLEKIWQATEEEKQKMLDEESGLSEGERKRILEPFEKELLEFKEMLGVIIRKNASDMRPMIASIQGKKQQGMVKAYCIANLTHILMQAGFRFVKAQSNGPSEFTRLAPKVAALHMEHIIENWSSSDE